MYVTMHTISTYTIHISDFLYNLTQRMLTGIESVLTGEDSTDKCIQWTLVETVMHHSRPKSDDLVVLYRRAGYKSEA